MDETQRSQLEHAKEIGREARRVRLGMAIPPSRVMRDIQQMMEPIRAARTSAVLDTAASLARPKAIAAEASEVLRRRPTTIKVERPATEVVQQQIAEATQQSAEHAATMAQAITMLAAASEANGEQQHRMFRWAQAGVIFSALAVVFTVIFGVAALVLA